MNTFIIIISLAIVTAIIIYNAHKNVEEEPTQVIHVPRVEIEKPKKKYYKNKKKKSTVANNAQVEKKPVGRPRKVTE